jgi:hypothetical protein
MGEKERREREEREREERLERETVTCARKREKREKKGHMGGGECRTPRSGGSQHRCPHTCAPTQETRDKQDAIVGLLEKITKIGTMAGGALPSQKKFKEMQVGGSAFLFGRNSANGHIRLYFDLEHSSTHSVD